MKKNEQIQIIGEEINDIKSKLVNQLEKMQMTQKHQMEKLTFCLLNSGNGNMENLAFHLFKSSKNSAQNTARGSINGSTKKKTSALYSRRGSTHHDSIRSNNEVPNSGAILELVGEEAIPEVNEGEDESKKKVNQSQRKSLKSTNLK